MNNHGDTGIDEELNDESERVLHIRFREGNEERIEVDLPLDSDDLTVSATG